MKFCGDCGSKLRENAPVRLCGGCINDRRNNPGPRPSDRINTEKFIAWLDERIGLERVRAQSENWARSLHRWEHDGGQVAIDMADRLLLELGTHLSRIPDDFYEPRRFNRVTNEGQREFYDSLREQGIPRRQAAEQAGLGVGAAEKRDQARRAAA